MRVPDSWIERFPFLEPLEEGWERVPLAALIVACAFYGLFLLQAAQGSGILLMMDLVFVPIHEGGHLLFRFFGEFISVAGGTMLQLGVPLMLATWFIFHRQVMGTAFCLFFFFENWLYTATYMADARAQALPLVTTGDPDFVEHDWYAIFSSLGVLNYDTKIAAAIRILGWCGMIAVVGWLAMRYREVKE